MSVDQDFTEKLTEAYRRIRRADGTAEGWLNGNTLDLRTALSRDEAAELLFGLQAPRGFKFQWIGVPREGQQ